MVAAEERYETVDLALAILKKSLIDTGTSIALAKDKIIFFGTDDYLKTGDINKCPRFSVKIEDLVK